MAKKHPHAEAIDRIGMQRIRSHFNISRQAVAYWRREGVPKPHLNSLMALAEVNGVLIQQILQKDYPA